MVRRQLTIIQRCLNGGAEAGLQACITGYGDAEGEEVFFKCRMDTPLEKLMCALDDYSELSGRAVMVEYILIAGVNDADAEARALGELLRGRRVVVNLIPYNQTAADPTEQDSAVVKALAMETGTSAPLKALALETLVAVTDSMVAWQREASAGGTPRESSSATRQGDDTETVVSTVVGGGGDDEASPSSDSVVASPATRIASCSARRRAARTMSSANPELEGLLLQTVRRARRL